MLKIPLLIVSAASQRFVQVPESSDFNARLLTGCRCSACRVWRGGLCSFVAGFVVLSFLLNVKRVEPAWETRYILRQLFTRLLVVILDIITLC